MAILVLNLIGDSFHHIQVGREMRGQMHLEVVLAGTALQGFPVLRSR
jgi:hypothetical protein